MPNTLTHFGAQGPLARLAAVPVDVKWVLLGCVLPDVPWIVRRGVSALGGGGVDPVGLRLYAIVQASLVFSVVLAAALALLSARPRAVFAVLAPGALLHLLLDAAQTKWGSGVHLFAPASWQPTNFGWFWPESGVTLALVAAGAVYLGWEWRRDPGRPDDRVPVAVQGPRAGAAALLAVAYLATPPLFFEDVLASGSHSLDAMVEVDDRVGREVELDRAGFEPAAREASDPAGRLTVTGGELRAVGELPADAGTVSVRGVFVDRRTVRVSAHHVHRTAARDLASYLGLGLLAAVWARDLAGSGYEA